MRDGTCQTGNWLAIGIFEYAQRVIEKGWYTMKIRKSILLLTFLLAASFVLAACGNKNPSAETGANGGNVLIAYFSHTGNTEEVA